MESEYISLSQSLRVLLPLRIVLDELATSLNLKHDPHSSIKSTIFEDNQACLSLASSDPPKMTPRSKIDCSEILIGSASTYNRV
jgi:hypothetical protein